MKNYIALSRETLRSGVKQLHMYLVIFKCLTELIGFLILLKKLFSLGKVQIIIYLDGENYEKNYNISLFNRIRVV